MSEEKRLAAVIELVNHDAVIVPRGAFFRDAHMKIRPNNFFKGLSRTEAEHVSSYLHFREPSGPLPLTQRTQADDSLDIFDSAEADQPKGTLMWEILMNYSVLGAWSVKMENAGNVVVLKSVHWPGYLAYHSLSNGKFGWIYIGTGQRNTDVGFML